MSDLTDNLPPHVLANYMLSYELECEYINRPKQFRCVRGNSTIAFMRFHQTLFKDREQVRREYFAELHEAVAEIEALLPQPPAAPKTYEDVIRKFGGRFTGESMVLPRQRSKRTVLIEE